MFKTMTKQPKSLKVANQATTNLLNVFFKGPFPRFLVQCAFFKVLAFIRNCICKRNKKVFSTCNLAFEFATKLIWIGTTNKCEHCAKQAGLEVVSKSAMFFLTSPEISSKSASAL
jgi:hypothetical protein